MNQNSFWCPIYKSIHSYQAYPGRKLTRPCLSPFKARKLPHEWRSSENCSIPLRDSNPRTLSLTGKWARRKLI